MKMKNALLLMTVMGGVLAPVLAIGQPVDPIIDIDDSQGAYATVINTFSAYATFWQGTLYTAANWVFWALATIQFAVSNMMIALRGGDLAEWIETNVKTILTIGVMFVILTNGYEWATAIIRGFLELGTQAANAGSMNPLSLDPSTVFQHGLVAAMELTDQLSVWSPGTSLLIAMCALMLLVAFCYAAALIAVTIVEAMIMIGVSVVFLGFGGSSWTMDAAKRVVLYWFSVGAKLFAMMIVAGLMIRIVELWTDQYDPERMNDILSLIGFTILLAYLVKYIPELIQGMLNGVAVNTSGAAVATGMAAGGSLVAAGKMLSSAGASLREGAGALMDAAKNIGKEGGGSSAKTASENGGGFGAFMHDMKGAGAHGMASFGQAVQATTGSDPMASGPLSSLATAPPESERPGGGQKKPDAPAQAGGGGGGEKGPGGGSDGPSDKGQGGTISGLAPASGSQGQGTASGGGQHTSGTVSGGGDGQRGGGGGSRSSQADNATVTGSGAGAGEAGAKTSGDATAEATGAGLAAGQVNPEELQGGVHGAASAEPGNTPGDRLASGSDNGTDSNAGPSSGIVEAAGNAGAGQPTIAGSTAGQLSPSEGLDPSRGDGSGDGGTSSLQSQANQLAGAVDQPQTRADSAADRANTAAERAENAIQNMQSGSDSGSGSSGADGVQRENVTKADLDSAARRAVDQVRNEKPKE